MNKKNGEAFFGYKYHAKVDAKSKFIDNYEVTDASVHDSQQLTDEQKANKKEKSKTKARCRKSIRFYGAKHEWLNCKICWHKRAAGITGLII